MNHHDNDDMPVLDVAQAISERTITEYAHAAGGVQGRSASTLETGKYQPPRPSSVELERRQRSHAARAGEPVDLVALRCSVIAKHDQIEAMSRSGVVGLEPLTAMTTPLLRAVDHLGAGNVAGAMDVIDDLFRWAV